MPFFPWPIQTTGSNTPCCSESFRILLKLGSCLEKFLPFRLCVNASQGFQTLDKRECHAAPFQGSLAPLSPHTAEAPGCCVCPGPTMVSQCSRWSQSLNRINCKIPKEITKTVISYKREHQNWDSMSNQPKLGSFWNNIWKSTCASVITNQILGMTRKK